MSLCSTDPAFVDFTANDNINSGDPETLASYESIIRRLVTEAQVPVVQVIFPFKGNIERVLREKMNRRDAHTAISAAYGTVLDDEVIATSGPAEKDSAGKKTLVPHRSRCWKSNCAARWCCSSARAHRSRAAARRLSWQVRGTAGDQKQGDAPRVRRRQKAGTQAGEHLCGRR
jgi:hypothetical protein